MPLYEYFCPKCNESKQFFHSMKEAKTHCDTCNGEISKVLFDFSVLDKKEDTAKKKIDSFISEIKNDLQEMKKEYKDR